MSASKKQIPTHVVDILGSTKGRDQPIMLLEKAFELLSCLDDELFLDDSVVFFDPFCKAGEIITAAAIKTCQLKHKHIRPLVSDKEIREELYGGRFFALSPDERHYHLSKRTFFGNDLSHYEEFTKFFKQGSYLSEEDGRLDENLFYKEFVNMIEFINTTTPPKKIVAIGNPPYQEEDGGHNKSSKPIYNIFYEALEDSVSIDEWVLVIPSRWFSGGKGLKKFREKVIKSKKVKNIISFNNPKEIFPTVDINGGVCFIHASNQTSEKCRLTSEKTTIVETISAFDAIPDDIYSYTLINKIKKCSDTFMDSFVHSRNAFGITSNEALKFATKKAKNTVICLVKERKEVHIPASSIKKNHHLMNMYKVAVPKTVGGTKATRNFLPHHQFFLVEPGTVLSETYIVVGAFKDKKTAENLIHFLSTSFCRYFLGLRKLTQQLPKDAWSWVPQVDFKTKWTDDLLAQKFNLTQKDVAHIKKKDKEWS